MDNVKYNIEGRAVVFLLLVELFSNTPTSTLFIKLNDENIFDLLPYLDVEEINQACCKLKEIINDVSDRNIIQLQEEYNNLFVINTSKNVYQWESPHRSADSTFMGREVLSFTAFLKRYNLEATNKKEPLDSVSNEFAFMYHLSILASHADSFKKTLWIIKDQKSFYELHINMWVDKFLSLMFNKAENCYFKEIAVLTKHILCEDYKSLCELIDMIESKHIKDFK